MLDELSSSSSLLSRVLGLGGSTSRMIRWMAANPSLRSELGSNGSVPVRSSYSKTPSE